MEWIELQFFCLIVTHQYVLSHIQMTGQKRKYCQTKTMFVHPSIHQFQFGFPIPSIFNPSTQIVVSKWIPSNSNILI